MVWGPFSIVWGLALVTATLFFYGYRDRSTLFFLMADTLLGDPYEYLCNVFTKLVFGTVFWDYSATPFNLDGHINLLYCFFWGFVAVAWSRGLYPILARQIAKIPSCPGKAVAWLSTAFIFVNMAVGDLTLTRYSARVVGEPTDAIWEQYMDAHYGDDVMECIYPYAKTIG